jgi:hypothetical protein
LIIISKGCFVNQFQAKQPIFVLFSRYFRAAEQAVNDSGWAEQAIFPAVK